MVRECRASVGAHVPVGRESNRTDTIHSIGRPSNRSTIRVDNLGRNYFSGVSRRGSSRDAYYVPAGGGYGASRTYTHVNDCGGGGIALLISFLALGIFSFFALLFI